jgi:hypothetical protein
MTTFNEALAEHGSAEEAVRHTLQNVYEDAIGDMYASFVPVAQWVLDNAPAIHQHQSGLDRSNDSMINALGREVDELAERVQALEDAPGPRPNAAEVSALRQRMDSLTETLNKMQALDTSDVLTALVRDVALLKDDRIIRSHPAAKMDHISALMKMFGAEPQTPEARKLLGLDVQPVATPEPDFNWVETACYVDGERWGEAGKTLGQWVGVVKGATCICETQAEARAWVEAQFNNPKNQ